MPHICLTFLCCVIFLSVFGQTVVDTFNLKFPDDAILPAKFEKAVKEQRSEFDRLFFKDSNAIKSYTVPFVLDKIDHDSEYNYLFIAEYWIAFHYKKIIPELIKRITVKKEIRLINTADLIIWERVQSGQMKYYGHGSYSDDDLFTIAGRANRLLKQITGEDFGNVSMKSGYAFLKELQSKWIQWLKEL